MAKTKEKAITQAEFLTIGFQYYVAGRFAALGRLMPVAGNLLHHAVEMFLKGALVEWLDVKELKAIEHNLPKLWERYQELSGNTELERYYGIVQQLQLFERIRYPDRYIRDGAIISIDIDRPRANPGPSTEKTYHLVLEDIDVVVEKLFNALSANPEFFVQGLNEDAMRYLLVSNKHQLHGRS